MRALTVYKRTTPTYRFTITDAVSAGIVISAVSIGISLTDSTDGTIRYLILANVGVNSGGVINGTGYTASYAAIGASDTGWISITLPMTFTAAATGTFTYEVFLFKAGTMVVIDNGTLELIDSAVPSLLSSPGTT